MVEPTDMKLEKLFVSVMRAFGVYRVDISQKDLKERILIGLHVTVALVYQISGFSLLKEMWNKFIELKVPSTSVVISQLYLVTLSFDVSISTLLALLRADKYQILVKRLALIGHRQTTKNCKQFLFYNKSIELVVIIVISFAMWTVDLCQWHADTTVIYMTTWAHINTFIHNLTLYHVNLVANTMRKGIIRIEQDIKHERRKRLKISFIKNPNINEKYEKIHRAKVLLDVSEISSNVNDTFERIRYTVQCFRLFNKVFSLPMFSSISCAFFCLMALIHQCISTLNTFVDNNSGAVEFIMTYCIVVIQFLGTLIMTLWSCEGLYQAQHSLKRTLAIRAAADVAKSVEYLHLSRTMEEWEPRLCAGPLNLRLTLIPAILALTASNTVILLQMSHAV